MKYLWPVVFCTSLFFTHQSAQADDAELNRVAKKIKTQIEKSMKKSKPRTNGYCDVFIDLDYSHTKQAVVKKVTTRGNKFAKSPPKPSRLTVNILMTGQNVS